MGVHRTVPSGRAAEAKGEGLRALPGETAGPFGIYAGWYSVVISALTIMVTAGFTAYGFGLFIKPVSDELGISRANTNLGLILFHLGSAISSPFMGRLMDRAPLLNVYRLGALSFGVALIGLGLFPYPLVMALLIVGPLALGACCTGQLFANVLVARWFVHLRARSLTIAAMGTSLSGVAIFPIVAVLISRFGWRTALIMMGIGAPIVFLALSLVAKPAPRPTEKDAAAAQTSHLNEADRQQAAIDATHFTPARLLRMRAFWCISLAIGLLLGVDQTLIATITPYVQDRDFSVSQVAAVMSATTVSALGGKLLIAWIADRVDLRILLALTAVCSMVMCGAMLADLSYSMLLVVCGVTGIAIGGTYPLGNAIVAKTFGSASVGGAMGLKAPIVGISSMTCLYFVGAMHDRHGSYDIAMMVFMAMALTAVLVTAFIPRTIATDS
jgi:MFS family permease